MSELTQYLSLYREQEELLQANSHKCLNALRATALSRLEKEGLPTRKNERYRYANLAADIAPDFGLNLRRSTPVGDPYKGYRCAVPQMDAFLYYVVNDVVCMPEGKANELPEGLHILPLCTAAERFPEIVKKHYHQAAGRKYDTVSELNTLFAQDGIFIYLEKGTQLSHAIQIVFVNAATADMMTNRRLLIIAEENTESHIVLCDHLEDSHRYLSTEVTEVFAGVGAKISLYGMEETQSNNARYHNLYIEQQAESRVSLCDMTLHNGHTRNQIEVRLLGEGADVALNGAYIATSKETLSNDIIVEHAVENCHSSMLHKYVVGGEGVSAFAGRVVVAEGAQQTLAEQTNANLLASPTARAFSQPMLEIYADDVKCNHGSTTGKLDEAALFYMRQRGIEEAEARLLLQHAFLNEVVETIAIDPLRERISALVEARFRGENPCCCDDGCFGCHR